MRRVLVLAHEMGHHTGATRQLRWSDIDPMTRTIRRRGKHEKVGDAAMMPATKDPFARMSRSLARDWWKKPRSLRGSSPSGDAAGTPSDGNSPPTSWT